MPPRSRVLLIVLALALPLAACSSFDPEKLTDFEFFNTKKKLAGERKPVFPGGVPGVTQGVPDELKKGYKPPPEPVTPTADAQTGDAEGQQNAQSQGEAEQPAAAKPKPKKQARVVKPKPQPQADQQDQQDDPQAQPGGPQAQPSGSSATPGRPQQTVWPAAPPPGTFSR